MVDLYAYHEHEQTGPRSHRSTFSVAPIAYDIGSGHMRRLDGPWAATGDSNLTIGKSGLLTVRIRPKLSGTAPVARFGHGGSHIEFTPLGTANVDGVINLAARSIRFPSAWAGGTDLELIDGLHFLRKNIHLRTGSPRSFAFRIDENSGLDEKTLAAPTWRIPRPHLYHPTKFAVPVMLNWVITRQGDKLVLTVTIPAGDWDGWILDPSPLVTQPDETSGKDTGIDAFFNTTNYSTTDQLYTGSYGGTHYGHLIQFDLSSIPSTATVTSATMRLVVRIACLAASRTIYWRAILQPWVESQSTWNIRSTGNNWTTAGCRSDGNDRQAAVMGSASIASTDTPGTTYDDVAQDTDVVQGWVDGTLANNGMVGQDSADSAGSTASHYYSSAAADAGDRPMETVAYNEAAAGHPAMRRMGGVPGATPRRGIW